MGKQLSHSEIWEISIIELKNTKGSKYKITRRMPELAIAETKIYRSKNRAKKQVEVWLEQLDRFGLKQLN